MGGYTWVRIKRAVGRVVRYGAMVGLMLPAPLLANPVGEEVVHGAANFERSANELTVTNTPSAIIQWRDFSVANGEITRFIQESVDSAVLNRVVGSSLSDIQGSLLSNGRVFLINPNGLIVGENAVIDVASFIGSTLSLSDDAFLRGEFEFVGEDGSISQRGFVAARQGPVILIATDIENSGVIQADNGDILLAAGERVLISDVTLQHIAFEVTAPVGEVLNLGELLAGGSVHAFAGTLTHGGTIQANAVRLADDGSVELFAADDITTTAASEISANGPDGGQVSIESASGTVHLRGKVEAIGEAGVGGTVELLGERVGLFGEANVSVEGSAGGGTVHIGGDAGGRGELPTARATYVGADAVVVADAVAEGDGGQIIVWSDENTRVHGTLSARGGSDGGDGGFIETSSAGQLDIRRAPDVSAPSGDGGTWLIDPSEGIRVVEGGAIAEGVQQIPDEEPDSAFELTATSGLAEVGVDLLEAALSDGAIVDVDATTTAVATADVVFDAILRLEDTVGTNTLRLRANNDVLFNGGVDDAGSTGQVLNLALIADDDAVGGGLVNFGDGAFVETGGGQIQALGSGVLTFDGVADLDGVLIAQSVFVDVDDDLGLQETASFSNLTFSGGLIESPGVVFVTGTLDWSGGTFGGGGILTVEHLHAFGPGPLGLLGSDLVIGGTTDDDFFDASFFEDTEVLVGDGALIDNLYALDLRGDVDFVSAGTVSGFRNEGMLTRTTGSGEVRFDLHFDLTPGATFDIDIGNVVVTQAADIDGAVDIAAGATLELQSGSGATRLNADGSVSGDGRLILDGDFAINPGASIADALTFEASLVMGDVGLVDAPVEIDLLDVIDGVLGFPSNARIGRLVLSGDGLSADGLSGGAIFIADVVRVTDRFDWFGGTIVGDLDSPGTLEIDALASFSVLGPTLPFESAPDTFHHVIDGATIANFGTATFENVSLATLDTTPLLNSGTIEFLGQNLLGVLGAEAIVIANDGELRFSSAAEVLLAGGLTNSAGSTFRVIDGDVAVVGDISMGGSAEIASGSGLELSAGTDGSVVNVPASGNITGEGLLDVTGDFILDGTVAVTQFDLFLGLGDVGEINVASTVGSLVLAGGTRGGDGVLTITDSLDWSGGGFIGAGSTVVSLSSSVDAQFAGAGTVDGHELEIASSSSWNGFELEITNGGFVDNDGTAVVNAASKVSLAQGATFANYLTATLDVADTLEVIHTDATGTFASDGHIDVSGRLVVSGAGTTNIDSIDINSGGTLELSSGADVLFPTGGAVQSGNFVTGSGATLRFAETPLFGDGASLSGPGNYVLDTFELRGTGDGTSFAPDVTLALTDAVVLGPGRLVNQGNLLLDGTSIEGSVVNTGTMDISPTSSNATLSIGALDNQGTLRLGNLSGAPLDLELTIGDGELTNSNLLLTRLDDGGRRVLNANLVNQGSVDLGADLEIDSVIHDGRMTLNGHALNVNGSLELRSGLIDGPGTLTVPALGVSGASAFDGVSLVGSSLRLSGNGSLVLSGGSLDGFDTSVDSGVELTLVNSALSGVGTLAVDGHVSLSGAYVYDGTIQIGAGGELEILAGDAGSSLDLNALTNSGELVLDSAAGQAAAIDVASGFVNGGVIRVRGGRDVLHSITGLSANASGATLVLTDVGLTLMTIDDRIDNLGDFLMSRATLELVDGSGVRGAGVLVNLSDLLVAGDSVILGSVVNTPSGLLDLSPAPGADGDVRISELENQGLTILGNVFGEARDLAVTVDGVFANSGALLVRRDAGGSRLLLASVNNTGTIDLSNVDLSMSGTLVNEVVGVIAIVDSTLSMDGSLVNRGSLELLNGVLDGAGQLVNEGNVTVATGSETAAINLRVTNQGEILIPAQTSLAIGGPSVGGSGTVAIDGVLDITTLTLASTFDVAGVVNGDILAVVGGGTVRLLGGELNLNELRLTGGGEVIAVGVLGIGTLAPPSDFDVAGSADGDISAVVDDGTNSLRGGVLSLNESTLTGGALVGDGVVNGMIFNDGLVSPGASVGVITVIGSYTQGSNGVLVIEVGGGPPFVAGVNHDGLVVDGDVSVDGTIRIVPLDDLAGLDDSVFIPLSFTGTGSGQFAIVDIPEELGISLNLRLTEDGFGVAEQTPLEELIEEIVEFLEEEGTDELVSTDEVVALADEQSELEGCDNDDVEDPAATTAGEHGVGCRGM